MSAFPCTSNMGLPSRAEQARAAYIERRVDELDIDPEKVADKLSDLFMDAAADVRFGAARKLRALNIVRLAIDAKAGEFHAACMAYVREKLADEADAEYDELSAP